MRQSRSSLSEGFIKTGADQKISPDVWEDLRVLLAFARAGTIAKCAELLGVTQPTVIRKLAALEAEMDRRLLVRSTRGSSLTQEGEKLVALADQIDRQVATALNATSIDRAEVVGNVRVSCTDGLLSYWLAPRVEEFKTEYPSVSLELYSTNEPPQLERREVDVVCSFLDFQSANILSRRVGFVHLVPFVSKSFVQAVWHAARREGLERIPDRGPRRLSRHGGWICGLDEADGEFADEIREQQLHHLLPSGSVGIGHWLSGELCRAGSRVAADTRPPRTHHDPAVCRGLAGITRRPVRAVRWLIGCTRHSSVRETRGSVRTLIPT